MRYAVSFKNKPFRTTARGIGSQRTGGRSGWWCSAHLFSSYLTWVKGNNAAAFEEVCCVVIVLSFFTYGYALYLIRGAHLTNPFHSVWASEIGTKVAVSLYRVIKKIWFCLIRRHFKCDSLYVIQAFSLTVITANLHHCGRDFCLSVFPLPVWHGTLRVQEHWWENTATSCYARG